MLNTNAKLPTYGTTGFRFATNSLGDVISQLLPYILGFAGLALFLMLIWGGVILMTAAGDPAKTKDGYGKLTAGFIGFLIIFISYFVAQIVEVVLGVKIL
ncbi:hypothetical protein KBB48_03065 [Candidatus Shapirobacteria bacterium]|nr:hypothetical protein [Candidatus Shapirobacteria bacterium]